MISLRNLTTLLNFCFALISWQASLIFAASPSCTLPVNANKPTLEAYMAEAQVQVAAKKWAEAEACLKEVSALDPLNRDGAFLRARVKAFQGQHKEASAVVSDWPVNDRESREIRGDLAWYRGDTADAEHWYAEAVANESRVPLSSWKLLLKVQKARNSETYPANLDKALSLYSDDPELITARVQANEKKSKAKAALSPEPLQSDANPKVKKPLKKKLKNLDPERPAYRAALSGTLIRETQNQNVQSADADAAVIYHRKSLAVGMSSISRDYGTETFTDRPFRASLGLGFVSDPTSFIKSHETLLSGGGTSSPTFTPKKFVSLRHEMFFSPQFSLYGELGAKWYPSLYVRTLTIGATLSMSHVRYQARIYNTHAQGNDLAAFGGIAYQAWSLIPELYALGGRDAASRPYLFDSENASFLAVGTSLTYKVSNSWSFRGVFEQRWESGFRQQSVSAVILWFDR